MSEVKWTKGPWRIIETISSCSVHAGKREVLRYAWSPDTENRANARLIAAAPDMYQLLTELRGEFNCGCGHPKCSREAQQREIDELLAKARGES